jgi:uncharacterized membrane protein
VPAATFLATAVEVTEMVTIVVGVGSVRGWRSTWLGAGLGVLARATRVPYPILLVLGCRSRAGS